MNKRNYEKPTVKSLDAMEVARGSCYSGSGEKELKGCVPGAVAVDPCTVGSIIYPRTVCTDGGFAGASCFSGTDAG